MAESAEFESDTGVVRSASRAVPRPSGFTLHIWLGWLDSNQRMPVSETGALPLGDTPILAGAKRIEHLTYGFGDRCSTS